MTREELEHKLMALFSRSEEFGRVFLTTATKEEFAESIKEGALDHQEAAHLTVQLIDTYTQAKVDETAKAYGGCTNCYGKGYSTYKGEYRARGMRWSDDSIKYCDCDRGKQLESLMVAKALEARIDEVRRTATALSVFDYNHEKMSGVQKADRLATLQAELEDGLTPRERMEKYEAERGNL